MWLNYNCHNEFQVAFASPTWADHNFKLSIAWKLEECISSNCKATSLFPCIHKHWTVISVVMLELLSEIHFCYKDWLIWFLLSAVSIYCISFLSLQCHTALDGRGEQKLLKVADALVITYQIAQTANAIEFKCPFPSPSNSFLLQVKNEVKQYLVVGDTILFWTVQVKWRGCKLMIQWEIVFEQNSYNSFPPLPMLHHSSMTWPFYPSPLPCHYLQMLSAQHMLQPKRFRDLFPPCLTPAPPPPSSSAQGSKSFQRKQGHQDNELKCKREQKRGTFMLTWGMDCNLLQPLFDDSCFIRV